MKLLLDTCVLSEWNRPSGREVVSACLAPYGGADLHLSVVTLGEIASGIAQVPFGVKRANLEAWAASLETNFAANIIGIDITVGKLWGRIVGENRISGRTVGLADAMLAATAMVHDLAIVTRNVRDFRSYGIVVIDPWEG